MCSAYLPSVMRFVKVNMDAVQLGHSGMNFHADSRRWTITPEFIFKTGMKTAKVYESMIEYPGTGRMDPT